MRGLDTATVLHLVFRGVYSSITPPKGGKESRSLRVGEANQRRVKKKGRKGKRRGKKKGKGRGKGRGWGKGSIKRRKIGSGGIEKKSTKGKEGAKEKCGKGKEKMGKEANAKKLCNV